MITSAQQHFPMPFFRSDNEPQARGSLFGDRSGTSSQNYPLNQKLESLDVNHKEIYVRNKRGHTGYYLQPLQINFIKSSVLANAIFLNYSIEQNLNAIVKSKREKCCLHSSGNTEREKEKFKRYLLVNTLFHYVQLVPLPNPNARFSDKFLQ